MPSVQMVIVVKQMVYTADVVSRSSSASDRLMLSMRAICRVGKAPLASVRQGCAGIDSRPAERPSQDMLRFVGAIDQSLSNSARTYNVIDIVGTSGPDTVANGHLTH